MSGVNRSQILGRLGQDPELRYMTNGEEVCNLSIATSQDWKDKQTGEKKSRVEWHKIILYRGLARIAAQYLKKGSQVYIDGRLQTRKWEKDGVAHYTTEIIANEIELLGSKDKGQEGNYEPENMADPLPSGNKSFDDDIPF